MPRYGPPPSDDAAPPPPSDDRSGLTRWSWRAKLLAIIATFGTVAAFVFWFLPPTGPDITTTTSTTVGVSSTTAVSPTTAVSRTTAVSPTTAVVATTLAP